MEIKTAIIELLKIVNKLQNNYSKKKKKFTLDGRLVGDIGEILAEEIYDFELYTEMIKEYDGETKDGRKIQVKATMKSSLTFPADTTPDYYIGIKIDDNANVTKIYNGPGILIRQKISHLMRPKNGLYNISIKKLQVWNEEIGKKDRIPERKKK